MEREGEKDGQISEGFYFSTVVLSAGLCWSQQKQTTEGSTAYFFIFMKVQY